MRGIPWDDLPNRIKKPSYNPSNIELVFKNNDLSDDENHRDFKKDLTKIGKRGLFGLICGTMTGFCFGVVDIVRDPKAIKTKSIEASKKLFRYSSTFGAFFAGYHGLRETLKLYVPMPPEENVTTAAIVSLLPLVVIPSLRKNLPYAFVMICIDVFNGIND